MEPERPIEKALRAAAAKRRAAPGKAFALHPVDRKALQAEVAQVYGSKTEPPKPHPTAGRGWIGWWPQIAWSFALVFGLAIAVTMMLPRSGPGSGTGSGTFTLAKNESVKDVSLAATRAQSLDQRLSDDSRNAPATRSLRDEREPDLAKSVAAGQAQDKEMRTSPSAAAPAPTTTTVPALAPAPMPNAPPHPPELAAAAGGPNEETQRFRSRYGLAGATPAAPAAQPPSPSTSVAAANEPASTPVMKAKDAAGAASANNYSSALADSKVQITNQVRTTLVDSLSEKTAMERTDAAKRELAANTAGRAAPAGAATASATSPPNSAVAALALQPPADAAQHAESLTLRQKFVQTATPAVATRALAANTPAILNSFDFEQTGSAIRITDQDGSVYIGRTQMPPAVNRRFADRKADNGSVNATSAYFFSQNAPATVFTVAGTNLTSGQLITFQGQLLGALTKSLNEAAVTLQRAASSTPSSSLISNGTTVNGLISTNAQLSGTVKIGTNPAVEIHARPTQTTRK